jgi:hypothetical protein
MTVDFIWNGKISGNEEAMSERVSATMAPPITPLTIGSRHSGTAAFLRSQFDFEIVAFSSSPKAGLAQRNNLGAVQGFAVFRSVSKIFEIVKPAGTAHLWWGMKDLRSYFSSTANTYGLVKACKLGKQSLQGPSVRSKHPENQPEKRTLCGALPEFPLGLQNIWFWPLWTAL